MPIKVSDRTSLATNDVYDINAPVIIEDNDIVKAGENK